ncbi:MAG: DASS family sodium-coupled anion symporter, partial [Alphaproteobacteria bacterium]|nr:DASS family sodium-coupled anion symporter [Alphaproteobacteria bacterium]
MAQRAGFWIGLAAFALMLVAPSPAGLSPEGWRVAAVMALMAIWWMTEALPLAATAMVPFLVFPLLGIGKADEVASNYYSPVIFLVLGGSLIALALERAGLHKRIALAIVSRGGTSPRALVFAYMAATALVSMFVANTATAVIMLPMALALIHSLVPEGQDAGDHRPFAAALVLGVAYAASLGGLGTLVGSPTNAISAGLIEKTTGYRIDFLNWLAFGIPIVLTSVPLAWWLLMKTLRVPKPALDTATVMAAIGTPGAWSTAEKRLVPIFIATVLLWVTLPLLKTLPGLAGLDDGMVAVAAGLALLLTGDGKGSRLLLWSDTKRAPWDVLLLYGGGLALAEGITGTGLAAWMGQQLEAVGG